MKTIEVNSEEEALILEHRKRVFYNKAYNNGLAAAARICWDYRNQSCGGTGEGGEVYEHLAKVILDQSIK